jgi:hypothetical protein
MDAKDGEINCMIFRLALYLARTTPNEPTGPPGPGKRLWKLPPAVSNQCPAAVSDSLPAPSTASEKVVPV